MSEDAPRHRVRTPTSRRVWKRIGIGVAVFLMLVSTVVVVAYKHLEGNISVIDDPGNLGKNRPTEVVPQALNVLVMGSDTRQGANGVGIGGQTPGLSDTTILLHLSADRKFAYGVSLPRDAMVNRPACYKKGGNGIDPGGLTQFNAAYAIGGPTCTVKTVEHLTGIRMNHFIVVDFVGFKAMVNAIGGVKICVPSAVDDNVGNISLPAGTYNVTGQQALDYVRVRHDIGAPTGDIGRMKRQQAFISAMIKKVVSAGTLANVPGLISFLEAATKSLTTDPGTDVMMLASLGKELKNIGLDKIQFITVPWQPYPADNNRVEWTPGASDRLWALVKADRNLGSQFNGGAVSPGSGKTPTSNPSGTPSSTPTKDATKSPAEIQAEKDAIQAAKDEQLREAGLCVPKHK
ncbi:MAG: LCP family protein [Marmoricola sp.]